MSCPAPVPKCYAARWRRLCSVASATLARSRAQGRPVHITPAVPLGSSPSIEWSCSRTQFAAFFVREWWYNTRAYRLDFFISGLLSSVFTAAIGFFLYHVVYGDHVTSQFMALAGTQEYLLYLCTGILLYQFTRRALSPVTRLLVDAREETLSLLIMTGVSLSFYEVGYFAFAVVYAACEFMVIYVVMFSVLRLPIHPEDTILVLVALPTVFVAVCGLGMLLSGIVLLSGDRGAIEEASFSVIYLVSGVLFPVEYLPAPLQWLSAAMPLTWMLRVFRLVLQQHPKAGELVTELLMLLVIGLIYFVIGSWIARLAVARALEQAS